MICYFTKARCTYLVIFFDVRKYGKMFCCCCWDIQIKEGSQKTCPHNLQILSQSSSSWNENYGRYCKQHFIRLFFENFDHIPSFLKLKKMASKIFLNRSFKNIYHLLICFINEIINDAAPTMIDLRFLHNSKVLIGRLPKVNYILFWLYTTHIKVINYSRLCVLAIV